MFSSLKWLSKYLVHALLLQRGIPFHVYCSGWNRLLCNLTVLWFLYLEYCFCCIVSPWLEVEEGSFKHCNCQNNAIGSSLALRRRGLSYHSCESQNHGSFGIFFYFSCSCFRLEGQGDTTSEQIPHRMGGFCEWIVALEKVPNWVHLPLAAEKWSCGSAEAGLLQGRKGIEVNAVGLQCMEDTWASSRKNAAEPGNSGLLFFTLFCRQVYAPWKKLLGV